jgi:DNA polymerase elongation subunit (family B)
MFKKLNYNYFSNKIDLWESVNGRAVHREIYPELKYYIHDKTNKSEIKDIYGNSVIQKIANSSQEMKRYKDTGTKTCDTDISIETKFLQSYYFDKEMVVDMNNINICTFDIEYDTSKGYCKVHEAIHPINLITLHFSESGRIVTLGLKEYTGNDDIVKEYHYIHSERMLLEKTIEIVRKEKPDILTGWNVELFDCLYFQKRCEHHEIDKNFSPLNKFRYKTKMENNEEVTYIKYDGLSVIDYLPLYKKFTYDPRENFTLQNIGMIELGEGKIDYSGTLNDLAETDWNGFVEYNVQDVLLVVKFENGNPQGKDPKKRSGLKLIELAVTICYEALIPFDNIFSQMAVLTGYILKFLHQEGMVLPDKEHSHKDKLPGAYVHAVKGMFKNVVSFDFESLYPTLIRQFNIGPDTLVKDPSDDEKKNCYSTPLSKYKNWILPDGTTLNCGGIYFRKDKISVLNKIVTKIFKERKLFKNKMFEARDSGDRSLENYYKRQQLIRKILINSMYGVLGNKHFHLFNLDCARAITLSGQDIIKFISNSSNDYFKNYYLENFDVENKILKNDPLCLLDTDSAYFSFDELIKKLNLNFTDDNEFLNWMNTFEKSFIKDFFTNMLNIYAEQFGVPNIMNFKREKIITDMIILAKKKYVTRVKDKEGEIYDNPKIEVTGIEIIKTSTPKFCRNTLLEMVNVLFDSKDREVVLKEISKIKKKFISESVTNIAFPRGISDYSKYAKDVDYYLNNGLEYPLRCPIQVRAAMNYNYTIKKHNLKLLPISNGSKIKFIYIKDNNYLKQDIIAFINEWPKEFDEFFKINYEMQFYKSFVRIIERFFDVLKWGNVNLKVSKMKSFIID